MDAHRLARSLVHLFTALGAVCALFATRAVLAGAWEEVFAWLGLALLIDGVDGTFARMADVTVRLPRFSGERLDLVVDYVTYVFVPALALLQAGYLQGRFGVLLASLILLSSLFPFFRHRQQDARTTASSAFQPFGTSSPSMCSPSQHALLGCVSGLVVACVVLTFVPMRWAHPLRTASALAVDAGS